MANGNFLSAFLFALCGVIPFLLAIFLLNRSFLMIATTNRGAKKIVYRETTLKVAGVRRTLLLKELKHFMSNPMLIMNMALSSIIAIIAGIVVLVRPGLLLPTFEQFTRLVPLSHAAICTIALTAVSCVNVAGAALVSLEGKQLWIIKSLPLRAQDILFSKVGMHIAVCGLPILFTSICGAIAFGGQWTDILLLLILPFLFSILMGLVGVTLNLLLPRFDWINEVQPAKQGLPVMLTMFGSMSFLVVSAVVYFFVAAFVTLELYMALVSLLALAIGLLLALYLKTAGSRRFASLQA
jgi:ABC-2 type transport system permease protein